MVDLKRGKKLTWFHKRYQTRAQKTIYGNTREQSLSVTRGYRILYVKISPRKLNRIAIMFKWYFVSSNEDYVESHTLSTFRMYLRPYYYKSAKNMKGLYAVSIDRQDRI